MPEQEYRDRTLTCRECGDEFIFTASESEFFASKGLKLSPSRCPLCRAQRRREKAENPQEQAESQELAEMKQAEQFLSSGQVRAAGTTAGVALERHLKHLCDVNHLPDPVQTGMQALVRLLQDAGVLTQSEAGRVSRLVSIRNKCSHPGPVSADEVSFLIQEARKFLQWGNSDGTRANEPASRPTPVPRTSPVSSPLLPRQPSSSPVDPGQASRATNPLYESFRVQVHNASRSNPHISIHSEIIVCVPEQQADKVVHLLDQDDWTQGLTNKATVRSPQKYLMNGQTIFAAIFERVIQKNVVVWNDQQSPRAVILRYGETIFIDLYSSTSPRLSLPLPSEPSRPIPLGTDFTPYRTNPRYESFHKHLDEYWLKPQSSHRELIVCVPEHQGNQAVHLMVENDWIRGHTNKATIRSPQKYHVSGQTILAAIFDDLILEHFVVWNDPQYPVAVTVHYEETRLIDLLSGNPAQPPFPSPGPSQPLSVSAGSAPSTVPARQQRKNVAGGNQPWKSLSPTEFPFKSVAWSPRGDQIASASGAGLYIWDAATGEQRSFLSSGGYPLIWSPRGDQIVYRCGGLRAIDATTLRAILTYEDSVHETAMIAWSPDEMFVVGAASYRSHPPKVWNAATGKIISTYTGHGEKEIKSLTWSPDARSVASGDEDGAVQVWDASTGQKHLFYHQDYYVYAVAWSPDGTQLASADAGKKVHLWEPAHAQGRKHRVADATLLYTGHTGTVRALAWSPKGMYIASGGDDETIQIWDARTGQTAFIYTGHSAKINALAWSSDGTQIVSVSEDKTIQLWQVPFSFLMV